MDLFGDTNIENDKISEFFSKRKDTEIELILKTLSLIIYQNSTNTDLVELYRLLGIENFCKVIMLFDGRYIKLPSANEFKEQLILSLVYYYKEILNLEWPEIKKKLPFEISGISCGIKIKQLNSFIKQHINEYLKNLDKKEEEEN